MRKFFILALLFGLPLFAQTNMGPIAAPSISLTSSYAFTNTATTDYVNNARFEQGLNPSANTAASQFGITSELFSLTANTKNFTQTLYGIYGTGIHYGSGTANTIIGLAGEGFNAGSGTATLAEGTSGIANCGGVAGGTPVQTPTNNGNCTNLRGVSGLAKNLSIGTVGVATALYAGTALNTNGGSITTNIGVDIANQTVGVTNYAVRTGLGLVKFGDHVGVEATPTTDVGLLVAPTSTTTTNQYAIVGRPTFPTSATNFGIAVYGKVQTVAQSFTMTNAVGLYGANPSKGVGSTVTNAYGIYVEDITAGGTKNRAIFTAGSAISEFDGGVQPASTGTAITWFQKATHASLDLASVASGACSAETSETITGTLAGDSCRVDAGTPAAGDAGSWYACRVSAADTVKWSLCNLSGGAIDRASDTYTIRVIR
jgi:hypothetical protein